MLKILALKSLIHELSQLPGIGPKSATRMAYSILRRQGSTDKLVAALEAVKKDVHLCRQCFSYTDLEEECYYCQHPNRRDDVICVVEEPSDIERIDAAGVFQGRFHVLHGAISPLDGIHAQDLKIQELVDRIEKSLASENPVTEVIFALGTDLEGDTTSLYLSQILHTMNIKASRIALGVPLGSDIDYIDDRTLGRALENRVEI